MKKSKTQKGITLVALIITIVVLLILAAVAIGTIQESKIIGHAQNAAKTYNQSKINEIEEINKYEDLMEEYTATEYSFTLNELGTYESVDNGAWILFNLSELWKVIGINLFEEEKYFTIVDDVPSAIIEADDKSLGNLLHYLGKVEKTQEIQCNVLTLFVEEENAFIISPMDKNGANLLGDADSGKMTAEEFMNTYGDVRFTFKDASSLEN